mmetsp:Transcript_6249/g.10737  ORF Transcript_6249/g.10737 Transcript_6249/m.10737 type:complete len:253 (+) Transcript_6249:612-1370(+)
MSSSSSRRNTNTIRASNAKQQHNDKITINTIHQVEEVDGKSDGVSTLALSNVVVRVVVETSVVIREGFVSLGEDDVVDAGVGTTLSSVVACVEVESVDGVGFSGDTGNDDDDDDVIDVVVVGGGVGIGVGFGVGNGVGNGVGDGVGALVLPGGAGGTGVGSGVGGGVGCGVGAGVGEGVGAGVGDGVGGDGVGGAGVGDGVGDGVAGNGVGGNGVGDGVGGAGVGHALVVMICTELPGQFFMVSRQLPPVAY